MAKVLKERKDVVGPFTWDLGALFIDEQAYEQVKTQTKHDVESFHQKYAGKLETSDTIIQALDELEGIQQRLVHLGTYVSLKISADASDNENISRQGSYSIFAAEVTQLLSFFESELLQKNEQLLVDVKNKDARFAGFVDDLLREKPHSVSPEVEGALAQFSQVFGQQYQTYSTAKMADIKFDGFEVNGKNYPMSFVLFENEWEFEQNHELRRAASSYFYQTLKGHEHSFAMNYQTEVLKQKAMANIKGFDSVIDYLLFDQKVSREMYNRQIDVIMEELAPAMRRYATLLKEIHGLDKMTFADLKLVVDANFEPNISMEASQEYMLKGLAPLGEEYVAMVQRAFDERWIDFPQNVGKRTGAFCSSPYGAHPYIMISWTERMREVFVLAHELGHAGHFYLAGQSQNIFNVRPSLYFIEAPSTMNELIVAENMVKEAKDARMKRWVYSTMISRTYYHNFVTHLLEAAFQREVYRRVDAGKPLSTTVFNEIMLDVMRTFWGDTVEIPDHTALTWMRQPHYYMGLYPYTYSAGLTIATATSQKLKREEITLDDWKKVLRAGGTKTPEELAKMVDVDISTKEPLEETITYISEMIDEIISLTHEGV